MEHRGYNLKLVWLNLIANYWHERQTATMKHQMCYADFTNDGLSIPIVIVTIVTHIPHLHGRASIYTELFFQIMLLRWSDRGLLFVFVAMTFCIWFNAAGRYIETNYILIMLRCTCGVAVPLVRNLRSLGGFVAVFVLSVSLSTTAMQFDAHLQCEAMK